MKKVLITLIIITMAGTVFSQAMPEVDKFTTSAGEVEIYFIGHGSLMFKVNDLVIDVDPVGTYGNYNILPKADLILVTHEHYDHLDPALIEKLKKPETVMYCNANSAVKVKWAQVMKNGDVKTFKGIKIEAVPAYNIVNEASKGHPFHPKGVGNGYILTTGDKRFYIAGDTENTPEMKALTDIYVAFLPMNLPYTMTPAMVVDAAKSFKPKILYPYHYGETNANELVNLLNGSGIEVRIRKLK